MSLEKIINSYNPDGMGSKAEAGIPPAQSEPDKPTYDYSFFNDLSEEDKTGIDEFIKTNKIEGNEAIKHRLYERNNDVKKFQRLADERLNRIKEIEPLVPEKQNEELVKYKSFIDEFKKNPYESVVKFKDELQLPDEMFVQSQLSNGGDYEERVAKWQTDELIPSLEKKYKLESGTFVYDPSEAYKVGTPSYKFREETENKVNEYRSEFSKEQNKMKEVGNQIAQQAKNDLVELRKTFFPDEKYASADEANGQFVSFLNELDEMHNSFAKGDITKNPTSVSIIFKGMHFDKLAKAMVDEAIAKLHSEYASKGLHLPSQNELGGIDPTKVKPSDMSKADEEKERRLKHSPLARTINRITN